MQLARRRTPRDKSRGPVPGGEGGREGGGSGGGTNPAIKRAKVEGAKCRGRLARENREQRPRVAGLQAPLRITLARELREGGLLSLARQSGQCAISAR